ncbi:hypothetical protein L0P92_41730, partial [Streptomyces muensis]|nr:hypothetical protein [Streptomyces muensis]
MSQQGGRPTGHEDDWWGQLYGDFTEDTGPTVAPDSLDDRFASAAGAVNQPATVPAPRADTDADPGRSTFPPGLPKPPGFTVEPPPEPA